MFKLSISFGRRSGLLAGLALMVFASGLYPATPPGNSYLQHNLVSDQAGVADNTDKNLVDPWGVDASAAGPFWVNNGGTGISSVYNSAGVVSATLAIVPSGAKGNTPATATGIVSNTTGGFAVAPGKPPNFIFVSSSGAISGWAPTVDATHAQLMVDNSVTGAKYFGLAISTRAAAAPNPLIFAPNLNSGNIDVFDTNYKPVTLPGGFADTSVPAGYAPYNIQNIGGNLYVAYAKQNASKTFSTAGVGLGAVAVFDLQGNLIKHLVTGGLLNEPWGLAIAPANFGAFPGALLVGNFGDGLINAFDATSGAFLGTLQDPQGNNIVLPGLWALFNGNGGNAGDVNAVYFSAGVGGGKHGLFGSLQAAPVITASAIGNAADTQSSIAPNTFISIFGANLAPVTRNWTTTDFAGTALPTALSGVSVTVNGKPAFVYYISPKQIDVLTPVDTATGPVDVVVTSNTMPSTTASVSLQQFSPALFLLKDGKSLAALHASGGVVGAATLYPGVSTPAKAGETIVLFGTGFGQTNPAIANGQIVTAPAVCVNTPTVSFGGTPAQVAFAGLVSAGVYQFNVVVPGTAKAGDIPVTISMGPATSAAGTIITVQ
jgi:uncharacterized protein (TIGR03118 family)